MGLVKDSTSNTNCTNWLIVLDESDKPIAFTITFEIVCQRNERQITNRFIPCP